MPTPAETFLKKALASGRRRSADVEAEAVEAGIPLSNLDRARVSLDVQAQKHGFGAGAHWTLELPRVEHTVTADRGWPPSAATQCMTCGEPGTLPKRTYPYMHTDPLGCDSWRWRDTSPKNQWQPGDCMGQYDTEHLTRYNPITGEQEHVDWAQLIEDHNTYWANTPEWQIPQPEEHQTVSPSA